MGICSQNLGHFQIWCSRMFYGMVLVLKIEEANHKCEEKCQKIEDHCNALTNKVPHLKHSSGHITSFQATPPLLLVPVFKIFIRAGGPSIWGLLVYRVDIAHQAFLVASLTIMFVVIVMPWIIIVKE